MNYLLYGLESFLIEKEISNIKEKYKFNDLDISKYDLQVNLIKEIIEDLTTVSLFSNKKLIIIDNAFIFSRSQVKKIDDVDLIEEYLEKEKNENVVIFIDRLEKIDSVKKITKLIKSKGIIKEFNKEKNISKIVKSMFEDYKITDSSIEFLISRVGSNLELISSEVEKLKTYKIDDKIITKEDIEALTSENIDIDIFKFVDDIINKNKKDAIKTYHELLKVNEEPIKIIALLASKFRLMYQATVLAKKGIKEDDIASILNIHKYPVHLAIIAGYKYNPKILLKYMDDLANLDIGIKTGEKDKNLSLELFILEL